MSGYRQSSYEPDAFEQAGRPVRPFDRVQRIGTAIAFTGVTLSLVDLAAMFGWLPQWADMPPLIALPLILIGIAMINSRREPPHDTTSVQHTANRRMLFGILAICALILGIAAAIDLLGA